MKVLLANPRGFCAGVVRAIDTVEQALERFGAPVFVRHEIVHNAHVVQDLRDKGAIFVDELDQVPENGVTIFSAHGVSQAVELHAVQRHLQVVDATCPLVKKVHFQGRQYAAAGYHVILIGEPAHPEVVGTQGQIPATVSVISTPDEVATLDLPPDSPVAYISQTTLSIDDTYAVIQALKQRYPQILGPEVRDICYAVQNRQRAVRALCDQVDVMLIVGSDKSANAATLRNIAAQTGIPSYLIADATSLREHWFNKHSVIGLSAAASTPEVLVQGVINALSELAELQVIDLPSHEERVQFRLPDGLIAHL